MLSVRNLQSSYGRSQVLFDVALDIAEGEVVTLLGRNGMGKTTTVRTIMGLLRPRAGTVQFSGREVSGATRLVLGDQVGDRRARRLGRLAPLLERSREPIRIVADFLDVEHESISQSCVAGLLARFGAAVIPG